MKWNKVEDCLPEKGKDMLVYAINENGWTFDKGEKYFAVDQLVQWQDGIPLSFRSDRFYGKVTHWCEIEGPEENDPSS